MITKSGSRAGVILRYGIGPKLKRWWDTGFDQNRVRDLRKRWRDMLVDCYPSSGIRQNLGRNAALGKKTECEMSMTEVRDAGFS